MSLFSLLLAPLQIPVGGGGACPVSSPPGAFVCASVALHPNSCVIETKCCELPVCQQTINLPGQGFRTPSAQSACRSVSMPSRRGREHCRRSAFFVSK